MERKPKGKWEAGVEQDLKDMNICLGGNELKVGKNRNGSLSMLRLMKSCRADRKRRRISCFLQNFMRYLARELTPEKLT
jgi:hypothetical protein